MRVITVYENYFEKKINYLYSMSAYHILVILCFLGGIAVDPQIFYKLTLTGSQTGLFTHFDSIWGVMSSSILILLIFLIDIGFLVVLMLEFKWMRLNYKKLILIEFFIIGISFFIPVIRDIMFFLSINSVSIYLIYRGLMSLPFFGFFLTPIFNLAAYAFIVQLVIMILFFRGGI